MSELVETLKGKTITRHTEDVTGHSLKLISLGDVDEEHTESMNAQMTDEETVVFHSKSIEISVSIDQSKLNIMSDQSNRTAISMSALHTWIILDDEEQELFEELQGAMKEFVKQIINEFTQEDDG